MECRRTNGTYAESSLLYKTCMASQKGFFDGLIKALRESKHTEALEILMDFYRN